MWHLEVVWYFYWVEYSMDLQFKIQFSVQREIWPSLKVYTALCLGWNRKSFNLWPTFTVTGLSNYQFSPEDKSHNPAGFTSAWVGERVCVCVCVRTSEWNIHLNLCVLCALNHSRKYNGHTHRIVITNKIRCILRSSNWSPTNSLKWLTYCTRFYFGQCLIL